MFLHGPDKKLFRFALSLPRRELTILVGLLTGHITLNRHLTVMKIQEDPICSACGEQEETSLHFLGVCYAKYDTHTLLNLCKLDIPFFGAHLIRPSELQKVETSTLLRFARAIKRFS